MRSADAIVKMLIANEVEVVFGVPGDTSMSFHDAFEKHKDQIRHISCRDERHAAYMADTYSRVSGKPGVVDVPSGGGVLYAVPGVSEAQSSSIPMICFSSDISMGSEETGALTELKQEDLMRSITKWNIRIKTSSKIPHFIRKAFRMATSGRPGAIHISIPENIHEEHFDFTEEDFLPSTHSPLKGGTDKATVDEAVDLFSSSKRPVILAGGGIHLSEAYGELEKFTTEFGVPVATTINGKGGIAETVAQSIGVIGVNGGTEETNSIIKQADLVVVLGSKLNNVTTVNKALFKHSPALIQVDLSEEILDLNIRTNLAVKADIKSFLSDLHEKMKDRIPGYKEDLVEWEETYKQLVKKKFDQVAEEVIRDTNYVNPAKIIDYLDKKTDENSVFVMDAGTQNPYMASNYKVKKAGRTTVFDRGHGNLGYALSASIGAKVARPEAKVFSLFGDGSFAMSAGELETASRLKLPIVFIHFQNNTYGWIKKLQQLYFEERYIAVDFTKINGAKVAEGFGVKSLRIDDNDKLEEGLKWAIEQNEPVFLDILIDPITDIIPPVTNWREDSKIDPKDREALTY